MRVARWRLTALVTVMLSAALTLVASRAVVRSYGRALADRTARSVAAYIRLVTRAAPRPGRGYDLPTLLIRVRGLDALPMATPGIEVYAATAPLVHATAKPLAPTALARLRQGSPVIWEGATVLAPLPAPNDSLVVGAVGVRAPVLEPLWFGGLTLPALLFVVPVAVRAAWRIGRADAMGALERYLVVAALLGGAAYIDARFASYEGTRRWVADTRTLAQEAARTARGPGLTDLAPLAVDGALLARDGGPGVGGHPDGRVLVRLGPGRVAELRAPRDAARPWLLSLAALALLGPGAVRLGIARTASRVGSGT